MNKKIISPVAILIMLLLSCGRSSEEDLLEQALRFAGSNRPELEKVLVSYANEPLKLEAAKFLIRNMPGHYSYADTTAVICYSKEVDSILTAMHDLPKAVIQHAIDSCAMRHGMASQKIVFDSKVISADFLIRNIDNAFDAWKNGPWAKHLSFDDFCEYLLPYKVTELQLMDDWRDRLKSFHSENLKDLSLCDVHREQAYSACRKYNQDLHDSIQPDHSLSVAYPPVKVETQARIPFGTCDQYAVMAAQAMRSQGIPIVRDFTPQWAYRSQGHSWDVLLASNGMRIPFSGICTNPGDPHKIEEKMAKVYRYTYSINQELRTLNQTKEFVPRLFRNIFIKDVTEDYLSCTDIKVKAMSIGKQHAYLCLYGDNAWEPIAYGRLRKGMAEFRNVGYNCLFIIVQYDEYGRQHPVSLPFVVQYDGSIRYIEASGQTTRNMELTRKYPVLDYVYWWLTRLEGGEFQASNEPDFKHYHLVHKITDCRAIGFKVAVNDTIPNCRYWRYYSDKKGNLCNMAEIMFFTREHDKPLRGKVIGTDGSLWDDTTKVKGKVFDGDLLTIYESKEPDYAWVGMDFGRPVKMSHLFYFGRGDGNCIEPGDTYELFLWDRTRWKSLGKQVATEPTLIYRNVPSGGLFLLRDLTKGHDERPFTYDDNRQIWW